jgi:hypothetical protein
MSLIGPITLVIDVVPTNVAATFGGTGAVLNWADPAADGRGAITGYLVQYQMNNDRTRACCPDALLQAFKKTGLKY